MRTTKKLGSVNPCNMLSLCDKNGRIIGECFDTPNAFACACYLNDNVEYGKVHYEFFGLSMRYKQDYLNEIALYAKQESNGNIEDINFLKREINFF